MLGVFAKAMAVNVTAPGRLIPFAAIVLFQGLVWSILFLRTGSLRLSIVYNIFSSQQFAAATLAFLE